VKVNTIELHEYPDAIELALDGKILFRHTREQPFAYAGRGVGRYDMYRGNFQVTERIEEMVALRNYSVLEKSSTLIRLRLQSGDAYRLDIAARLEDGRLVLAFSAGETAANRWRFFLPAESDEHVYGCGEQFSYFDLRGRHFPLWTGEQGVGRNKKTYITRLADLAEGAGGDYFWTFFPQTSFMSSRAYWAYLDTSAYAVFDFRDPDRHELYAWGLPERLVLGTGETMMAATQDLGAFFGRQRELPDWVHDGIILGIQGGTGVCREKLAAARRAGVPVCGIWAQDWQGIRMTSFGQRLRWNWEWDQERYPGLDRELPRLAAEGVRFLGYINPYVLKDHSLYQEALEKGYLARNAAGGVYLVDFGEFDAGIVDLTLPEAFDWYKGIIKRNLIAFGLAGWMADFGEYLPTDAILASGIGAELAHNQWPALWARCNREAVDETSVDEASADESSVDGTSGDRAPLFFMRAGGPGSQQYCPLMWAGDQNVDWSPDDGLPSVIPAALSLALSGHGLHHSDIGGYTTLFFLKRSRELFMRWTELAVFTPLMRTHEGNRPASNHQFDGDEQTLAHLARMVRLHVALKPYIKALVAENAREGVPVMRPLFLHYEADRAGWTIQDQYLFGPDLLVAPVLKKGAKTRLVHLPADRWVHLWTGAVHGVHGPEGHTFRQAAPLGCPPVFYRADSPWSGLFRAAKDQL